MARAVAVGVLEERNSDGTLRFLMSRRPANKPLPHLWEFPGGKLEAGESAKRALVRELKEEIGVECVEENLEEWFEEDVSYGSFVVHLHYIRVRRWFGTPKGCEGQQLSWEHFPLSCAPVLLGVLPVLRRLALEHGAVLDEERALGGGLMHVACQERLQLGESPVWAPPLLLFCDILAHALHALEIASGRHYVVRVPGPVSCIVPRSRGGYIVAMGNLIAAIDGVWLFPVTRIIPCI